VLPNPARVWRCRGQQSGRRAVSAEGNSERFALLAAEVVGRKPDVIIANSNSLVRAFMAGTPTIPIVAVVTDPVAAAWCPASPGRQPDRRKRQCRNGNLCQAAADPERGGIVGDEDVANHPGRFLIKNFCMPSSNSSRR
jgi:hypothetical protein